MDVARDELSRICGLSNPWSWSVLQDASTSQLRHSYEKTERRYYFLDRKGSDPDTGDTALHRLMALHVPPSAVRSFLKHLKAHEQELLLRRGGDATDDCERTYAHLDTNPPLATAQNHLGCTALHVALHRNSWHVEPVVQLLLSQYPRLASVPMRCGSYPLHICTGHSLTINSTLVETLIRADPSVCHREDDRGDTPLSLLWKNVLRFRWAQQWEMYGVAPDGSIDHPPDDLSWMTMVAPNQFRDLALEIIGASGCDPEGSQGVDSVVSAMPFTWHTLVGTPRCPPLLVRLLLEAEQRHYVKGRLVDRDDQGRLPLHIAAGSQPPTWGLVPKVVVERKPLSVVELLVKILPHAASAFDDSNALPLHYLLRGQVYGETHREADVVALLRAFPDALLFPDPATNLFPALQLASQLKADPSDGEGLNLLYGMLRSDPEIVLSST